MRHSIVLLATMGIANISCSADVSEANGPDPRTVQVPLSSLPVLDRGNGEAECSESGLFVDADGAVVACFSGGVRVATGDVTGDGLSLVIQPGAGGILPPTYVIPEGAPSAPRGRTMDVVAARGVAIVAEGADVPSDVQVPENCEGVVLDVETEDAFICNGGLALLLPAIQQAREAAASDDEAVALLLPAVQQVLPTSVPEEALIALLLPAVQQAREAAASDDEAVALLLPAVQQVLPTPVPEEALIALLLPAVQQAREAAARSSQDRGAFSLVVLGSHGGSVDLELSVEGRGAIRPTPDGLGVAVGASSLVATGRAHVLPEARR
jgi:hypothetical protein